MAARIFAAALAALAPAAATAQPGAPAAPPGAVDYVTLGDGAQSARLERLLDVAGTRTRSYRRSLESGLGYAACLDAWRGNEQHKEACMRSRLPGASRARTIVLSAGDGEAGRGGTLVSCIGAGGSGRTVLSAREDRRDAARLRQCIERGLRQPGGGSVRLPQRFAVRYSSAFEVEDVEEARRSAAEVVLIAVDHVGVPRGNRGRCLVQGRIVRSERGSAPAPDDLVELAVPCATQPALGSSRTIGMGEFRRGTFARIYLSGRRTLHDFERVTDRGQPAPR